MELWRTAHQIKEIISVRTWKDMWNEEKPELCRNLRTSKILGAQSVPLHTHSHWILSGKETMGKLLHFLLLQWFISL